MIQADKGDIVVDAEAAVRSVEGKRARPWRREFGASEKFEL
jgi:hypothetical protein